MRAKVPIIFVRLLCTWYVQQSFCVKWGTMFSNSFNVTNGVRQGGILSPILFNFYLEDLSHILIKAGVGCFMNGQCFNHLFYADDCVLIGPSPRSLQVLLNLCEDFADRNELVYNEKKTKCMVFMPRKMNDLFVPDFKLKGATLNKVIKQKYLGVFLCENQMDDCDIQRQMKSIYGRGNMLIRKFKFCTEEVKIKLFKAYCNSFYCSQLWCKYKKESIRKLTTAYKRIYRNFIGLNYDTSISYHFVCNNVDAVDVVMRKLIFSLRSRVLESDNDLVSSIISSPFMYDLSLTKAWHERLF